MPSRSVTDRLLLDIAGAKAARLAAMPPMIGRSFRVSELIQQIVSDRLQLAGYHLRNGDILLGRGEYRTSISRHYYAMYHAARAVVFADSKGDDHQGHSVLPNHLPTNLDGRARWVQDLKFARLIRNEADYDLYPTKIADWSGDARGLAVIASDFTVACNDYALSEGLV
ncbi:HEPN domain-containing protein [Rhodococcus sp. RD6.2]|uniref:HEPN domain-containing protein n=1 Tax=Rhodococcus sp. RD6.2 TaxID=260936 RepID=UPI00155D927D|nr:HEPN domain-containing protein [Rhodococcus sp. RD6.2]